MKDGDEFKNAKDMASGKLTCAQYSATIHKNMEQVPVDSAKVVGAVGAVRMLSIWLICLVGGTAYKIAAG